MNKIIYIILISFFLFSCKREKAITYGKIIEIQNSYSKTKIVLINNSKENYIWINKKDYQDFYDTLINKNVNIYHRNYGDWNITSIIDSIKIIN